VNGWRKSSYSNNEGGACVETASVDGRVLVRDTTNRRVLTLTFTVTAWQQFTASLR
jgi:hypothetical protein